MRCAQACDIWGLASDTSAHASGDSSTLCHRTRLLAQAIHICLDGWSITGACAKGRPACFPRASSVPARQVSVSLPPAPPAFQQSRLISGRSEPRRTARRCPGFPSRIKYPARSATPLFKNRAEVSCEALRCATTESPFFISEPAGGGAGQRRRVAGAQLAEVLRTWLEVPRCINWRGGVPRKGWHFLLGLQFGAAGITPIWEM